VSGRARAVVGSQGEQIAALHLQKSGFEIVARNARVGRLEIDLIARRGELLVFCEVRARSSRALLEPIETIDLRKRARIRQAALLWLSATDASYSELRFDAASVVFDARGPELTYYEDAF
jgi:putative endonuclease